MPWATKKSAAGVPKLMAPEGDMGSVVTESPKITKGRMSLMLATGAAWGLSFLK